MVDLGIKKGDKNKEEYKTKFLSELEPGEEIEGEIHIGDIKERKINNKDVFEFFVILTDHENQIKWICGIIPSYYPENGNIYGEKESRIYTLVDSMNHVLNKAPRNKVDSYSVKFETFKDNINENVAEVKIKAVQSWKPGARYVNLEVLDAQILDSPRTELSKIESLTKNNIYLKRAYTALKNNNSDINKKSIAFEVKSYLDEGEITKSIFMEILKELDKI